jgi:uncharacterized repeat protein (TIGR01451 family)
MGMKNNLLRPALLVAAGALTFYGNAAFAANPLTFSLTNVGRDQTATGQLDQVDCAPGEELQSIKLDFSEATIRTSLILANTTQNTDFAQIDVVQHDYLGVTIPGTPYQQVKAPPPNSAGPFTCTLDPGENQTECNEGALPQPLLATVAPSQSVTLTPADGANFDFFRGNGTVAVNFRVGGFITSNIPATWEQENLTPALAGVALTPTCVAPEVVCTSKTLMPSDLSGPDGVVDAQVNLSNPGAVDVSQVVITDTMDSTMTYVAGTSSIGEPTGGPPTYTFPTQSLAAGSGLGLTYQVNIQGLNPGEQSCNDVQVKVGNQVTSQCQACVTRPDVPTVPAVGWLGLSVLLSFFAGLGGLLEYRRRKTNV